MYLVILIWYHKYWCFFHKLNQIEKSWLRINLKVDLIWGGGGGMLNGTNYEAKTNFDGATHTFMSNAWFV